MSFTISNIVYACQGNLESNLSNKSNVVTGIVDFALLASAVTIAGLMLGGILNFGLPMGVGTIGNYIAWSCVGVGGGIALADIITAIVIKSRKVTSMDDSIRSQYYDLITGTQVMDHTKEEVRANKAVACHQIMNGLYLGNSEAFAQTTHFDCRCPNTRGMMQPLDTSNPLNFTTIITVCPMQAIFSDYVDWVDKSAEDFAESFSANEVTWHHVGKMALDDPSYWEALAYDCTYLDTELGRKTLPKEGLQQTEFEQILQAKSTTMLNTPVEQWFEPIFKEIDEGVINGKRVLVHCQAGQSRSATILAAYLINRFRVSSAQAIAFLKSKRLCVDPKFATQLNAYAEALQTATS
jgi:hypothetical protein